MEPLFIKGKPYLINVGKKHDKHDKRRSVEPMTFIDDADHPELEILSALNSLRTYHVGPDEAFSEAMRHLGLSLEIIEALCDAFDREVARSYLKGRDDEARDLKKRHNDALFRTHCEAFNSGFDCALRYALEDE